MSYTPGIAQYISLPAVEPAGTIIYISPTDSYYRSNGTAWLLLSDTTNATLTNVSLQGATALNSNPLLLKANTDSNHLIGWKNTWGGVTIDGPMMIGYAGGGLGTTIGGSGEKSVLTWDSNGAYIFTKSIVTTDDARLTVATTSKAGLMSATDKTKLDGLQPNSTNPLIVTGLDSTNVTAGNFAVLPYGSSVLQSMTVDPRDLDNGIYYYKAVDGTIYRSGGPVPYSTGGLTAGQLIVPTPPSSVTARNWNTTTNATDLIPTLPTRATVLLGVATSTSTIDFYNNDPMTLEDTTAPIVDPFTSYTLNDSSSVATKYATPWATFESGGTATPPLVGSDTSFPNSIFLRINAGTTNNRKLMTRIDSAGMVDGQVAAHFEYDSGSAGVIRFFGRAGGATGSAVGVCLQVDFGVKDVKFVIFSNDVLSIGKNAAGVDIVYPMSTLTMGNKYKCRFEFIGTILRGKVWDATGTEPSDWQLTCYDSKVTTPGLVGIGANIGYYKIGSFGYSKNLVSVGI